MAELTGRGGTKSAVIMDNATSLSQDFTPLDSVMEEIIGRGEDISLLKIDTDGWDHDVIMSAAGLIKRCIPLIFFECQFQDQTQHKAFEEAIEWLESVGYESWHVFDNYGGYIMEAKRANDIKPLMSYICRQNDFVSTRTFYYIDILAAPQGKTDCARDAVADFLSQRTAMIKGNK